MRFLHEQEYAASAADVATMLADPAFRKQVCQAQNATDADVRVDSTGATMTVVVDQTRRSDDIPAFAQKLVGDRIRLLQREQWSGPTEASLEVAIPGKPGELNGAISLTEDGDSVRETISGELVVRIPLLGAKLEKLISDLLHEALEVEQQVGRDWLADRR
jgi:hypothetical protein